MRLPTGVHGVRLQSRAEQLSESDAMHRWHQLVLTVAPDYEKYARRTGTVPPIFHLVPAPSSQTAPA